MSGVVEIVGAASAFTTLLQLANKICGTFDRIPQNKAIYHETTRDLVETLELFEALYATHQDRIDNTELSQSLTQFSTLLRRVHKKSAKAFKQRKGIARVKMYYIQWARAGEIKGSLLQVNREIQRCYQRFLLGSIARIEHNQASTSAQMDHGFRQVQETLGALLQALAPLSPAHLRGLQTFLSLHQHDPLPPQINIREGMIVFSRASMECARMMTKRRRGLSLMTSSARRLVAAIAKLAGRDRPLWPSVVLFTDKPEAEHAIVAPITGRHGYLVDDELHGILGKDQRRWHFPISNTPTHRVMSPIPGQGEIDQEFAGVPNWASRIDQNGVVKTGPQYLALGLPIICKFSDLRANPEYQRFELGGSSTKWCQQKSLSFMSDEEIKSYALSSPSP